MNYKRNYLYFKNPRRFNFVWLIFFLLIIGGLVYAFIYKYIEAPLAFSLIAVFFLLGIAFGYMFPLRYKISDQYIDKQVQDAVVLFEKLALDQLKLPDNRNPDLQTVRFYDFVNATKYQDIEILHREGKDNKIRYSQCRLTSYFFLEEKFIAYFYEFSLIKPWLAEGYTNYYYKVTSSKEVHEVNTEDNPYLQMVSIVNK